MLKSEAQHFFDTELCPRWPDWKPTLPQASDWIEWLMPLSRTAALSAVKRHAAGSRFKAPVAAAVFEFAKADTPRPAPSSGPNFVTLKAVYRGGCTLCTMRLGRRFEFVPCVGNRPVPPGDTPTLLRAGEAYIRQLRQYPPGGQFELLPPGDGGERS